MRRAIVVMVLLGCGGAACIPDAITGAGGGDSTAGTGAAAGSATTAAGAAGSGQGGTGGGGMSAGGSGASTSSQAGGSGAGGTTSTTIPCSGPLDCPDPGPCASRVCYDHVCETEPMEDGMSCGDSLDCLLHVCKNGLCAQEPLANDTVVKQGTLANCIDLVCMDLVPTEVPNYKHCNDPLPDNCRAPICDSSGACIVNPTQDLPAGTPCIQNLVPGICDGNGNCVTG